eukprot:g46307.t1
MLSSAVRRALPEATLADKDSFQFRYLLAQEAESRGVAEAARRFDVTYQKALWWSSKLRGAHPGLHGGHRYQTLSPEAQIALEWIVFSPVGSRSQSSRHCGGAPVEVRAGMVLAGRRERWCSDWVSGVDPARLKVKLQTMRAPREPAKGMYLFLCGVYLVLCA